jgi:hypothetical protein
MPPNEECPSCHLVIADWHVEWFESEGPLLYRGLAAMDCPSCRGPVGFKQGKIGLAPQGSPVVTRSVEKAAEWAAFQAVSAGGTLQGYLAGGGAGMQYANYWTKQDVLDADTNQKAK